jgi:hypothetical protein
MGGAAARAASLARADGSIWIVGSTLKLMQYQWLLRVPAVGTPVNQILDPGRILAIVGDGGGGASVAGVLGAPSDRGWFGTINAFGSMTAKQTYLSGRAPGVIHSLNRTGDAVALAMRASEPGGPTSGWLTEHRPRISGCAARPRRTSPQPSSGSR